MSCLTPAQIITIRSEIGNETLSGWSDVAIEERADLMSSSNPLVVALSILRERLAGMRNAPTQWSLSGDYNENWSANLHALRTHVADLQNRVDAETAGVVGTVAGLPIVTGAGQLVTDGFRLGDYD